MENNLASNLEPVSRTAYRKEQIEKKFDLKFDPVSKATLDNEIHNYEEQIQNLPKWPFTLLINWYLLNEAKKGHTSSTITLSRLVALSGNSVNDENELVGSNTTVRSLRAAMCQEYESKYVETIKQEAPTSTDNSVANKIKNLLKYNSISLKAKAHTIADSEWDQAISLVYQDVGALIIVQNSVLAEFKDTISECKLVESKAGFFSNYDLRLRFDF